MLNPFKYSSDNKRYHTLNYYYKQRFGSKVFKISIDGGFSCPNKDGKSGYGGCTFCSSSGSGDFAGNKQDDIITQMNKISSRMHEKWPEGKYIAYFQANTNTYAPVSELKEKYEMALTYPDVIGLNIGTRPDALTDDVINYLAELNEQTFLNVELGLQTIHDETAKRINRGYDYNLFLDAVKRLREKNIFVTVHLINGLPGENKVMMIDSIKEINSLDIQSIKIHLLHVITNTKLAVQYQSKEFELLEKDEYIDIVCDQLELLDEKIIIQRLTGDGKKEDLIGPLWSLKKFIVLNDIDKELVRRNSYQGSKVK